MAARPWVGGIVLGTQKNGLIPVPSQRPQGAQAPAVCALERPAPSEKGFAGLHRWKFRLPPRVLVLSAGVGALGPGQGTRPALHAALAASADLLAVGGSLPALTSGVNQTVIERLMWGLEGRQATWPWAVVDIPAR
jgi:hypothetical protein